MSFAFFSRYRGGPGEIRGRQMAEHLKGRLNPTGGYEQDVCVYILAKTPEQWKEPQWAYHDLMDSSLGRVRRIVSKTHGALIASSVSQRDALAELFAGREIFLIPQHHCNFAREVRTERPVKRVGCIGGDAAVQWPHWALAQLLESFGLEWVFEKHYHKRSAVVEFYRTLDIQVCFRPTHQRDPRLMRHLNCLKLVNAGSFGIPTVAYPEPAYVAEWGQECLYANTMNGIVAQVRRLAEDPGLYKEMAARASEKAEAYHIDLIADRYRALPGGK